MTPDDHRLMLEASRDRLTALMASEEDGSKAAALSRELRQVLETLQKMLAKTAPESGVKNAD